MNIIKNSIIIFLCKTNLSSLFSEVCINLKLKTRKWGNEISWNFGPCSSSQVYENGQVYFEQCCLPPGEHTLTCEDSWGDGWHGGWIKIDGTKYCDDFTGGSEATAQVTVAGKYVFVMFAAVQSKKNLAFPLLYKNSRIICLSPYSRIMSW